MGFLNGFLIPAEILGTETIVNGYMPKESTTISVGYLQQAKQVSPCPTLTKMTIEDRTLLFIASWSTRELPASFQWMGTSVISTDVAVKCLRQVVRGLNV